MAAGAIQGAVVNGTTGAPSPIGLIVTLHGYDDFNASLTMTATTDNAGAFTFQSVPNVAGRFFMLSVPYEGVPYNSDLLKFDGNTTINAKVRVYEATADPSVLRVTQLHLVFDLAGDGTTVTEICLFSNSSERTFMTAGGAGFTIPVPTGAAVVAVQTQQGSIAAQRTAQGLEIRSPLLPGPSTADLDFTFRLLKQPVGFEQALPFPVDSLTVLVPDGKATLQGANLQDGGKETFQTKPYHVFDAANLAAGQKIAFQINGDASSVQWPADPSLLIVGGLGLLNLVLVAVIGAMLWRQYAAPGRRTRRGDRSDQFEDKLDVPRGPD